MPEYISTPVDTTRTSMLAEGIHELRVVDFDENMGGSGYPYWSFTLEVNEGGPWDGFVLWTNISLSPKARFKMDEWLDAFSIPEGEEAFAETFVGKRLRATIVHGIWNNRKRPEVDAFLPATAKMKATKKKASGKEKEETVEVEGMTATEGNGGLPEDVVPETKKGRRAF